MENQVEVKKNNIEEFKFHYVMGVDTNLEDGPKLTYSKCLTSDQILKCVAEQTLINISEDESDKNNKEKSPAITEFRTIMMSLKARVMIQNVKSCLMHSNEEMEHDELQEYISSLYNDGKFESFLETAVIDF